jgi:hypothetical protein
MNRIEISILGEWTGDPHGLRIAGETETYIIDDPIKAHDSVDRDAARLALLTGDVITIGRTIARVIR